MRFIGPECALGEGPLWHPLRNQLFWFDIPAGRLHVSDAMGGQRQHWDFGEPASAAGWIDEDRLIVATASALNVFRYFNRAMVPSFARWNPTTHLTRSNDGRIAPDGSFWIGTMALDAAKKAGAYYRYKAGGLDLLLGEISIPNATCFSPDKKTAYLADGGQQTIWRWALDEAGNPIGERQVHVSLKGGSIYPDGAVCDAEGYLWNAQWAGIAAARAMHPMAAWTKSLTCQSANRPARLSVVKT